MPNNRVYQLVSSDQKTVRVDGDFIRHSTTLVNLLQDMPADDAIPIPTITASTLEKVKAFCKLAEECRAPDSHQFVAAMDQSTLFEVVMAANFLDMKLLLDVACTRVAELIRHKTTEEIRQTFGVVNDFTPEEEEQVRREYEWATG